MKTTEQLVQIRTLKSLIAEMVAAHKSTKSTQGRSGKYLSERDQLFVAYTAYHILRKEVNADEYIQTVIDQLRPENKSRAINGCWSIKFFGQKKANVSDWNQYADFAGAVKECLQRLDEYILAQATKAEENGDK